MTKHVSPRPPASAPEGNVGQSNPNKQVIQPPRPTTAPGKPAAPSLSGPSAAVDSGGGAVDFSSRQPGGSYTPRP